MTEAAVGGVEFPTHWLHQAGSTRRILAPFRPTRDLAAEYKME